MYIKVIKFRSLFFVGLSNDATETLLGFGAGLNSFTLLFRQDLSLRG